MRPVALAAALLCACSHASAEPAAPEDVPVTVLEVPAPPVASAPPPAPEPPRAARRPTSGPGPIGVPPCDEFLEMVRRCIEQSSPMVDRHELVEMLESTARVFRREVASPSPAARADLAVTCQQMKSTFASRPGCRP